MSAWIRTSPFEPGYYWMREAGDAEPEHIVELQPDGSVLRIGSEDAQSGPDIQRDGFEFWSEPITMNHRLE